MNSDVNQFILEVKYKVIWTYFESRKHLTSVSSLGEQLQSHTQLDATLFDFQIEFAMLGEDKAVEEEVLLVEFDVIFTRDRATNTININPNSISIFQKLNINALFDICIQWELQVLDCALEAVVPFVEGNSLGGDAVYLVYYYRNKFVLKISNDILMHRCRNPRLNSHYALG